jgi:hypothetical protein
LERRSSARYDPSCPVIPVINALFIKLGYQEYQVYHEYHELFSYALDTRGTCGTRDTFTNFKLYFSNSPVYLSVFARLVSQEPIPLGHST